MDPATIKYNLIGLDFAADLIPERQQDNSGEVSFPARESTGSSFILFRPIGPFHALTGSKKKKQLDSLTCLLKRSLDPVIHPLVLVEYHSRLNREGERETEVHQKENKVEYI